MDLQTPKCKKLYQSTLAAMYFMVFVFKYVLYFFDRPQHINCTSNSEITQIVVVYCIIIAQNFATMAVRISVICIRFVSTFCVINHDNMMHRFLWYSCTFGIVLQKCNSSTMGPKIFKLISLYRCPINFRNLESVAQKLRLSRPF